MNTVPLTNNPVSGVQLATATVSINVIQVNGKQMTLSVFRQIEERNIGDNVSFLGWVDYPTKDKDGFAYWILFVDEKGLAKYSYYLESRFHWKAKESLEYAKRNNTGNTYEIGFGFGRQFVTPEKQLANLDAAQTEFDKARKEYEYFQSLKNSIPHVFIAV